ncbi:thiolase family protein [Pacificimonas sp. ICDLI1SI03]
MAVPAVIISGVGQSAVGKRLDRTAMGLTVDAIKDALDDAGLTRDDIDGVSCYPGARPDMPAFGPVGSAEIIDALRLNTNWYSSGLEGAAQLAAIVNGYAAIKAGLARHVICVRTVTESSGGAAWKESARPKDFRTRVWGEYQWQMPFNAITAIHWLALYAQRHFHVYGTKREHLGAVAVNARTNGLLNPKRMYDKPLTMEDYLAAEFISSPFCLFDCDAPTDASTVIILSHADAADDLKAEPVFIDGVGSAGNARLSWDQAEIPRMAAFDAAAMLWERSDFKPSDVDVAELYDGFSFLTLTWLEALGFCGLGESGPFVEGGHRIALDGELPLNTNGGQLSAGRTHGFGFVHEAVTQLRKRAGKRQVGGDPKLAVAAAGGGPMAGALLLARH